MTRFIDELHLVGTLADPHLDEYDGEHWTTPSILRDDGKENNGEETQRATIRTPRT